MRGQLARSQYARLASGDGVASGMTKPAMARAMSAERARFPFVMLPDFSVQGMTAAWLNATSAPLPLA